MASRRTCSNQQPLLEQEEESDSDGSSERKTLETSSSTKTVIGIEDMNPVADLKSEMNSNQLAFKLYEYEDKITRYESHSEFLVRCVKEKVIPMGLRIKVEPAIGDPDE